MGGGLKISNFQGPLKLTPFYRDSRETPQFGGQEPKLSRGNFWGEFPLAFSTFWSPISQSPIGNGRRSLKPVVQSCDKTGSVDAISICFKQANSR